MPGKRDRKKRERGNDGGGMASFLGIGGGMPDFNDDDLEAELLALAGGGGGKKGKKKSSDSKEMSMADINKMVASAHTVGDDIGDEDGDGDGDDDDIDESDLLAELEGMDDDDNDDDDEDEPVPVPAPSKKPPAPPVKPSPVKPTPSKRNNDGGGGGDLQIVNDRLAMYKVALEASKSKGDTSKARRYERAIGNLNQMVSDVRGGKKINLDDLPPEVSVPTAPATSTGSNKATSSNVATGSVKDDEDDLNELAKWIGGPSVDAPPISKKPSLDTSVIEDRLKLYQDALKVAEDQKDSSKIRRYKRAVDTIISLQKEVKGGKKFSEEDLPPVISIVVPKKAPPTTPPTQSTKPKLPTEIDLDAPEFDEFNLSEEDMAAMMSSFLDDRNKAPPPPEPAKPTPPKPAPRTKPVTTPPRAPPPNTGPPVAPKPSDASTTSRPPGLIDLDTPEFAEFDLSDEDMAMLAAQMEQSAKKSQIPIVPSPRPSEDNSQSLPAKITHPVDTGETVTKNQVKLVLMERKDQYMKAMQGAKVKGDTVGQKKYGTVAVQFDRALKGLEQDQVMDLKGIPPPPPGFASIYNYDVSLYKSTPPKAPPSQTASPQSSVTPQESSLPPDDSIPVPKTPLEALEQRLEKYHQGLKSAQEKGESSRVRRTNRIIKQYEDAIKMTKAGKEVDYDELPVPPGYPPIPAAPKPRPVQPRPAESRPVQSLPASVPQMKLKASVNDQQIQLLRQRGAELQRAAKEAKANGDKDTAIRYVRFFKGVEQMLSAAQSGMPVDMSQVPASPYSDPTKATPSKGVLSHLGKAQEGDDQTFDLIENQLQVQIDMCSENSRIYEGLGNLGASSQYKNMSDQCQRDLLAIKGIRTQGLTPPKFTMEMRKFAIVHSNPGMSDKKIEVEVVRGITLPAPSGHNEEDMNVYVEIEFPWPSDSAQKAETDKVAGSSNPEFNSKHQFDIDRKQLRSLQRTFKRHPLKCMVYQYRMLRKNIFIGMVLVPLEALESKCELRVSDDLKDEKGKRPAGGKLELFVRLREPLSGCDQEEKEQKWLVFQESIAAEASVKMLRPAVAASSTSPIKVEQTTSLDALKLELSIVQNALKAGKRDPEIVQRGRAIQAKMQAVKQKLQHPSYKRDYMSAISQEIKAERVIEQDLLRAGNSGQARIIQGRRKVMENEITKLQSK